MTGPTDIQPLVELLRTLSGEHGFITQALSWIAALRLALKPGQLWLRDRLAAALARAAASDDPEDDRIIMSILSSPAWRIAGFVCDLITSLKLPSVADFRLIKITQTKA